MAALHVGVQMANSSAAFLSDASVLYRVDKTHRLTLLIFYCPVIMNKSYDVASGTHLLNYRHIRCGLDLHYNGAFSIFNMLYDVFVCKNNLLCFS